MQKKNSLNESTANERDFFQKKTADKSPLEKKLEQEGREENRRVSKILRVGTRDAEKPFHVIKLECKNDNENSLVNFTV